MKSAGKARNNGLYRHIRTSKEIIRNLLNDSMFKSQKAAMARYTVFFHNMYRRFVLYNIYRVHSTLG